MVSGNRNLSYEVRLRVLNLPEFEDRLCPGDLNLACNIQHGNYEVPVELFFPPVPNRGNRRHNWKCNCADFE